MVSDHVQRHNSRSTTEAETWGLNAAAKELGFTRNIADGIGICFDGPTPILTDSNGTFGFVKNAGAKHKVHTVCKKSERRS